MTSVSTKSPPASAAAETLDAGAFREAMSRVPGAVHVVATTGADGVRAGFTATAVTAVSDHPPTLLVCANAGSDSARAVVENGVFGVSTLAWEDEPVASRFAGRDGVKGEARFALGRWTVGASGAPLLETALVSFECRVVSAEIVGTHYIVVGEVLAVTPGRGARALIYRERAFHAL